MDKDTFREFRANVLEAEDLLDKARKLQDEIDACVENIVDIKTKDEELNEILYSIDANSDDIDSLYDEFEKLDSRISEIAQEWTDEDYENDIVEEDDDWDDPDQLGLFDDDDEEDE